MAAGALKSAQETNRTATPVVMNDSNESGRVHSKYFNYTVAGAALDAGTTIDLVQLPAGARFVGGKVYVDGTFAGAGVTIDVGDSADTNRLGAAIAVDAEAWTELPNTPAVAATAIGFEVGALPVVIYATTAVGVIVAGGIIKGRIDYVLE